MEKFEERVVVPIVRMMIESFKKNVTFNMFTNERISNVPLVRYARNVLVCLINFLDDCL